MVLETIAPAFIPGAPGGPELVIILFIAILLFGANKIPKLARSTGEAMGEFQKGKEKVDRELEEMRQATSLDNDYSSTAGQGSPPPSGSGSTGASADDAETTEPEDEASDSEAEEVEAEAETESD